MTSIKSSVEENKHGINANRKDIDNNKSSIEDLKSELRYRYDSSQAALERIIHRLIIIIILALSFLVLTNAAWIYAWNTWDNAATTTIHNEGGVSNFVGGDGVINDGKP